VEETSANLAGLFAAEDLCAATDAKQKEICGGQSLHYRVVNVSSSIVRPPNIHAYPYERWFCKYYPSTWLVRPEKFVAAVKLCTEPGPLLTEDLGFLVDRAFLLDFLVETHDSLFYSDVLKLCDFDRKAIWTVAKHDDDHIAVAKRAFNAIERDTLARYVADLHPFLTWFINTHEAMARDVWVSLTAASSYGSHNLGSSDLWVRLQRAFIRIIVSRIIRQGKDSVIVQKKQRNEIDTPLTFTFFCENNDAAAIRMVESYFKACRVKYSTNIDGVLKISLPAPQHLQASAGGLLYTTRLIFSSELVLKGMDRDAFVDATASSLFYKGLSSQIATMRMVAAETLNQPKRVVLLQGVHPPVVLVDQRPIPLALFGESSVKLLSWGVTFLHSLVDKVDGHGTPGFDAIKIELKRLYDWRENKSGVEEVYEIHDGTLESAQFRHVLTDESMRYLVENVRLLFFDRDGALTRDAQVALGHIVLANHIHLAFAPRPPEYSTLGDSTLHFDPSESQVYLQLSMLKKCTFAHNKLPVSMSAGGLLMAVLKTMQLTHKHMVLFHTLTLHLFVSLLLLLLLLFFCDRRR
jgi:hypothetical protein